MDFCVCEKSKHYRMILKFYTPTRMKKSKVPFENLLEKIFNMPLKWNENEIYLRAPSSSPNTKTYRNISCLFINLASIKTVE